MLRLPLVLQNSSHLEEHLLEISYNLHCICIASLHRSNYSPSLFRSLDQEEELLLQVALLFLFLSGFQFVFMSHFSCSPHHILLQLVLIIRIPILLFPLSFLLHFLLYYLHFLHLRLAFLLLLVHIISINLLHCLLSLCIQDHPPFRFSLCFLLIHFLILLDLLKFKCTINFLLLI